MNIGEIDFPRALLEAQRNGNLVVFAGAGVSRGQPSSLPLFSELAAQIGNGESPIREGEPLDAYLGRLADGGGGLKIHEAAVKILSRPDSRPTDLHRSLLRLFLKDQAIRLVTTNFDSHFSNAASDLGIKPRIFHGPALPLGGNFDGIVHLHGSLQDNAKELVLTDVDFGSAYLTEAWASRFLYQMFLRYTVLFVGYSHGDVVMNYVAKGISTSRSQPKYILTEDTNTSWRLLGISPIHFDHNQGPAPYSVLSDAVRKWADEIQRGLHEKSERIRTIVEGAPPVDKEDADYLRESLLFVETARHFANFTKLPEYISWMADNGFLTPLFQNDRELSEADLEIAIWYIRHCIPHHHESALFVFQKASGTLNGRVGLMLHRLLCNRDDFPSTSGFSTWVKVLLSQSNEKLEFHHWEELLESCQWPQDEDVMILLLERCFHPRFLIKKSWSFSSDPNLLEREEGIEEYVNLSEEHSHFAARVWDEQFKPNLAKLAFRLFPILVASLEKTHLLLYRQVQERTFDSLNFTRQTIRGYGYTSNESGFGVLVDATRDVLKQLIDDHPSEALGAIGICFQSPSFILKRIAVYGMEVNQKIRPSEKVEWILTNSLLFKHEIKPEVFSLLRTSFSLANKKTQKKLISRLMKIFKSAGKYPVDETIEPYTIYNLLQWLNSNGPASQALIIALETVQRKHPDYRPRSNPNLNWSFIDEDNEVVDESPANIKEPTPEQFIKDILDRKKDGTNSFDYREQTYSIHGLVAKNTEWGFKAHRYLVDHQIDEPLIWNSLYNGWRDAIFDLESWKKWFSLQENHPNISLAAKGIAEVLDVASQRKDNSIPSHFKERAFLLSVAVYNALKKKTSTLPEKPLDWLGLAINRAGGYLAQFWIQYLSQTRGDAKENWKGFPPRFRNLIKNVAVDASETAILARVVLAGYLQFLFSSDSEYTKKIILPFLDWSKNKETAEQCWQGYLAWGQWRKAFLPLIFPFYQETLDRLAFFEKRTQESFAGHIAAIAIYGYDNPLTEGWLYKFIERFDPSLRYRFARTVRKIMEDMSSETVDNLWIRWLKQYWEGRLINRGAALSEQEMKAIIHWPLCVVDYFSEAVELLKASPRANRAPVDLNKDLPQSLFEGSPNALGEYLVIVLECSVRGTSLASKIHDLLPRLERAGLLPNIKVSLLNLTAKYI